MLPRNGAELSQVPEAAESNTNQKLKLDGAKRSHQRRFNEAWQGVADAG